MRILRNGLIGLVLLLVTYISVFFLFDHKIEKLLIESVGINKEQIIRDNSFSTIRFKISDSEDFNGVSLNLLTGIASFDAKVKAGAFMNHHEEVEHNFTYYGKLSSYPSLIIKLIKGITPIDLFNHMNDFAMKGEEKNAASIFDIELYLTLPNKRNYTDIDDLKNDLPRKYILSLKDKGVLRQDGSLPDFVKAIYEFVLPSTSDAKLEISFSDKISWNIEPRDLFKKASIAVNYNSDSLLTHSALKLKYGMRNNKYQFNFDISQHIEPGTISKIYEDVDRNDAIKTIFFMLHRFGYQLDDDTKAKIELLCNTMIASYQKSIDQYKALWAKDMKSFAKVSISLDEDLKNGAYEYNAYDNMDLFTVKLDGKLDAAKGLNGTLYIHDKLNQTAQTIAFVRLVYLMKLSPLEEYRALCKYFDNDVEGVARFIKNSSDDPLAADSSFTYHVGSPADITVNKYGKSLADLVDGLARVFIPLEEDDDLAEK